MKSKSEWTKNERQEKILAVIEGKKINKQEDLKAILDGMGYSVTQATLSRDINELRLVKVNGYYQAPQQTNDKRILDRFYQLIETSLISAAAAENIAVLKTHSGMANALCVMIDSFHSPMILGTLAGDDTILVVAADKHAAKDFAKKIEKAKKK